MRNTLWLMIVSAYGPPDASERAYAEMMAPGNSKQERRARATWGPWKEISVRGHERRTP